MLDQQSESGRTNPAPEKDTPQQLNQDFDKVFEAEIDGWVSKHCEYRSDNRPIPSKDHPDPRNELVGLAMSGGGTRSAVFNLGVVQALAQYGLMNQVDYMSTVSGGGYTGSSLTSLCADELPYETQGSTSRLDMTRTVSHMPFRGPLPRLRPVTILVRKSTGWKAQPPAMFVNLAGF